MLSQVMLIDEWVVILLNYYLFSLLLFILCFFMQALQQKWTHLLYWKFQMNQTKLSFNGQSQTLMELLWLVILLNIGRRMSVFFSHIYLFPVALLYSRVTLKKTYLLHITVYRLQLRFVLLGYGFFRLLQQMNMELLEIIVILPCSTLEWIVQVSLWMNCS